MLKTTPIDEQFSIVTDAGEQKLTRQQFAMMQQFLQDGIGSIVSVEKLAMVLWGDTDGPENESVTLRIYISRLRQLVEHLGFRIKNLPGDGYYVEMVDPNRGLVYQPPAHLAGGWNQNNGALVRGRGREVVIVKKILVNGAADSPR